MVQFGTFACFSIVLQETENPYLGKTRKKSMEKVSLSSTEVNIYF